MLVIKRAWRWAARRRAAAVVITALAAVCTAAMACLSALLGASIFRALPYPNAQAVVLFGNANPGNATEFFSPAMLADLGRRISTVEVGGYYYESTSIQRGASLEQVVAVKLSPGSAAILGRHPEAGRLFLESEESGTGGADAVLISHRLASSLMAGGDVVGTEVTIGDHRATVVGVMPPDFWFPSIDVDVWVPARLPAMLATSRQNHFYLAFGRLAGRTTIRQAGAEVTAVEAALSREFPDTDAATQSEVSSMTRAQMQGLEAPIAVISTAVLLLVLIGCANVATIMFMEAGRNELSTIMELALGGTRIRVGLPMFVAALFLAVAGTFAGGVIAGDAVSRLAAAASLNGLRLATGLKEVVVLLVTGAVMATSMIAGAWAGGRSGDVGSIIGAGARVTRRTWFGHVAVAAQVSVTIVLLTLAVAFMRSLVTINAVQTGIVSEGVFTFRLAAEHGESPLSVTARQRRVIETLMAIPLVASAAISGAVPGTPSARLADVSVEGAGAATEGRTAEVRVRSVSQGYFDVLGIAVREGRVCSDDQGFSTSYLLVNHAFENAAFVPGASPLGARVRERAETGVDGTIRAVVSDSREDGQLSPPQPTVYTCGLLPFTPDPIYLVKIRDAQAATKPIVDAMGRIPGHALYVPRPLDSLWNDRMATVRNTTGVLMLLGGIAALVAGMGLSGLLSQSLAGRQRDIAVRIVLGATPTQMVIRELKTVIALFAAAAFPGLLLAFVIGAFVTGALAGVNARQPLTFAVVVMAVLGALVAVSLPPILRITFRPVSIGLRES